MALFDDAIFTIAGAAVLAVIVAIIIFVIAAMKQRKILRNIPEDMPNQIQIEKLERETVLKLKELREMKRLKAEKEEKINGKEKSSQEKEDHVKYSGESIESDGGEADEEDGGQVDGENGTAELPPLPERGPDEIARSREIRRAASSKSESSNPRIRKSKRRIKPGRFTPI